MFAVRGNQMRAQVMPVCCLSIHTVAVVVVVEQTQRNKRMKRFCALYAMAYVSGCAAHVGLYVPVAIWVKANHTRTSYQQYHVDDDDDARPSTETRDGRFVRIC